MAPGARKDDRLEPVVAQTHRSVLPSEETVEQERRRGPPAVGFRLSLVERHALETLLRAERTPLALARRAKVILALDADNGSSISVVATALGHDRKYVRMWRERYLTDGIDGLKGRARSGRPIEIGPVSRCELISMACAKPADFGVAHRNRWTVDSLTHAYQTRAQREGLDPMSRTSVLRVLNKAELRPHRIKMWLHSPDPLFREKVTDVCALYLDPPPGALVLCVDEKTGIQALGRKHPGRAASPGQEARMDYEYVRNGTRKLLACWNVQTGEVYAQMRPNRRAADLVEFMESVARRHPRGEIHIIWDNLNIHYDGKEGRWTEFNQRHDGRFHFHYTPIHASWVNQIDLWFGILQRRIIDGGVFDSLEELDEAVLGFVEHWNRCEGKPFRWSFTGYPLQTGLADG